MNKPPLTMPPVRDMSYQQTAMGPAVDEYLRWKETEDGARPITIVNYRWHLARMCKRLPGRPLRQVSKADMRDLIAAYPAGSRRVATAVFNNFWGFQRDEGYITRSPMEGVRAPRRRSEQVYEVFSEAEEAAIITAGPDTRYGRGVQVRDKACLLILLRAGIRNAELRALRVRDVDLAERWLIVRDGKGGKPRVVPVRGELVRALEEFMLTDIPRLNRTPRPEDHLLYRLKVTGASLLCHRERQVLEVRPDLVVASSTAWRWWTACLERAGVPHRKVHMARHTYATNLLRATGGDLSSVGKALGHASLTSTEVYLHAEVSDLAAAVAKMTSVREGDDA
jgi:site-specific recombinase XerD